MGGPVLWARLSLNGVERPAVVLVVNGSRHEGWAKEISYVRLSRARDLLVVCGDLELIRRVADEAVARRPTADLGVGTRGAGR